MKKWKLTLVAAAVSSACLLGGCGTSMYELTDEEQDIIVQYAAQALAKYNTFQKDGMTNPAEEEEAPEESTQQTTKSSQPDNTEADSSTSGQGQTDGTQAEEGKQAVSLAEAIGHSTDLNVSYAGAELTDTYQTDDAYAATAPEGKKYLVMKFTVTNPGTEAVNVDLLSSAPEFSVKSGSVNAKAELTILSNDLSTYQGSIGAGQTVENVLLFAVPDSMTETGDLTLSVKRDGTTEDIQL